MSATNLIQFTQPPDDDGPEIHWHRGEIVTSNVYRGIVLGFAMRKALYRHRIAYRKMAEKLHISASNVFRYQEGRPCSERVYHQVMTALAILEMEK